jgi:hypothetical protein
MPSIYLTNPPSTSLLRQARLYLYVLDVRDGATNTRMLQCYDAGSTTPHSSIPVSSAAIPVSSDKTRVMQPVSRDNTRNTPVSSAVTSPHIPAAILGTSLDDRTKRSHDKTRADDVKRTTSHHKTPHTSLDHNTTQTSAAAAARSKSVTHPSPAPSLAHLQKGAPPYQAVAASGLSLRIYAHTYTHIHTHIHT